MNSIKHATAFQCLREYKESDNLDAGLTSRPVSTGRGFMQRSQTLRFNLSELADAVLQLHDVFMADYERCVFFFATSFLIQVQHHVEIHICLE